MTIAAILDGLEIYHANINCSRMKRRGPFHNPIVVADYQAESIGEPCRCWTKIGYIVAEAPEATHKVLSLSPEKQAPPPEGG